jgi:hypothetical protein
MIERHRFRGHAIELQLLEVAPNQVRWIWKIDGRHSFKSQCTLPSMDMARSEALMYAQIVITRLDHPLHAMAE